MPIEVMAGRGPRSCQRATSTGTGDCATTLAATLPSIARQARTPVRAYDHEVGLLLARGTQDALQDGDVLDHPHLHRHGGTAGLAGLQDACVGLGRLLAGGPHVSVKAQGIDLAHT